MKSPLLSIRRCTLAALLTAPLAALAQTGGVRIGTPGAPDPSAVLDLQPDAASAPKGFLPPRLTYAQRTSISNAATGLLVYQSDASASPAAPAGYYFYTGTQWLPLLSQGDNLGNHTATQNLDLAANQLVGNGGSQGLSISGSGRVGVGVSSPASQLANTSQNIVGTDGFGIGASSLTWNNGLQGYTAAFYNGFNSYGGGGLAVKVATNLANTAALDVSQGTNPSAPGTSLMRVQADGNVGIGTATPARLLHVLGGPALTSTNIGTSPLMRLTRPGTSNAKWDANAELALGTYATGINSQTQLDFNLGNGFNATPDQTVLTLRGDGRVGVGTTGPLAQFEVDLPTASAAASLKLEHRGSNLIVRPAVAGGGSTVVENTAGNLLLNPSGGNVGIGTAAPRAKLDVNGAVFMRSNSVFINGLSGATSYTYTWNHNLGYKPLLMLSVDGTGGSYSEYIACSYEDVDNATTIIHMYNNFSNVFVNAYFSLRWIAVGQQ